MKNILQIAIDGNSGSGKTSLSHHLKSKYGLFFIDSGTIYNFAVYILLQIGKFDVESIEYEDLAFIDEVCLLGNGDLLFEKKIYDETCVCTDEVKQKVSFFAKNPLLRQRINEKIWQTIEDKAAVVNGRDIGTVVLPNASLKIFLHASVESREAGWSWMLEQQYGYLPEDKLQELRANAILRDTEDSNRKIAPLSCADDAISFEIADYSRDEIWENIDEKIDSWLSRNISLHKRDGVFLVNSGTVHRLAAHILLEQRIAKVEEIENANLDFVDEFTLMGDGSVKYRGESFTYSRLDTEEISNYLPVLYGCSSLMSKIKEIVLEVLEHLNCVVTARDYEVGTDYIDTTQRTVLSILIPTYNRATILKTCLDKLLQIKRQDIEFVVSDDCSEDNTVLVMQSYDDSRITFYQNRQNGGASYNSHLCFLRAKGKYALLISDEDDLFPDKVEKLTDWLKDNDDIAVYIGGGMRGENDIKSFTAKEYMDGYSALQELGYKTRYMTGIVFNVTLYQEQIGAVSYRMAPDTFNVYSFMYAMAKLFFAGRVITSDIMLFEETRFTKTTITNNIKSNPDIFYFEPNGRSSQIKCGIKSLKELPLNQSQQEFMIFKIFYETTKVALRIFEEKQLERYREMIPEHFSVFQEHIEGFSREAVINMLFGVTAECAAKEGICSEKELVRAISENEEICEFLRREKNNGRDYLPLFS